MIRVLSLGGGIQSVTVARMSLLGDLPRLDHVVFADTGDEWPETYDVVADLERSFTAAAVGFHRVRCELPSRLPVLSDTLMLADKAGRWSAPPLYVQNLDGSDGFTNRQCTGDYKKAPIEKKLRQLAGIKRNSPGPKHVVVETWLGISADEKQRMKVGQRWQRIWHPLIEGPQPMTRWDCEQWLRRHGFEVPVKSACWHCPYQANARWRACKDRHPDLWRKAVALDRHLRANARTMGLKGQVYLHSSRRPLDEVDLRTPKERGQASLFEQDGFGDECGGYCGV